jgi:hypothetical protein
MGSKITRPPTRVTLVYKQVHNTHEFFAREVRGLIVQHPDLRTAYDRALAGLSAHVSLLADRKVAYKAEKTFEEFKAELDAMPIEVVAKIGMPLVGRIHSEHAAA